MDGPDFNSVLTCRSSSAAKAQLKPAVNVLFPTPPFPLRTKIFLCTPDSLSLIRGRSGSGPLGPSAQTDWLGHPSHASVLPASVDSVPYVRETDTRNQNHSQSLD
jgi:hypothetical protein